MKNVIMDTLMEAAKKVMAAARGEDEFTDHRTALDEFNGMAKLAAALGVTEAEISDVIAAAKEAAK